MKILISELNPLHFVQKNKVALPQYRSRHIDDYHYEFTNYEWMQFVEWAQPWQQSDSIRLQVLSQAGPVTLRVYDNIGDLIFTDSLTQKEQSFFDSTLYIHELDLILAAFTEGYYRLELDFGGYVSFESNTIFISDVIENSLLIEYSHFKYREGIYFENEFTTSKRIVGALPLEKPGSNNVVYTNQSNDQTLLSSRPFRTWRLYTGGPEGTPDFQVNNLNMMLGCSNLMIDGKLYTRATEGAQLEERSEEGYPLRGWSIELRDKLNRGSKVWDEEVGLADGGLSVVINVEAKGFLSNDTGGSFYEVKDIN